MSIWVYIKKITVLCPQKDTFFNRAYPGDFLGIFVYVRVDQKFSLRKILVFSVNHLENQCHVVVGVPTWMSIKVKFWKGHTFSPRMSG